MRARRRPGAKRKAAALDRVWGRAYTDAPAWSVQWWVFKETRDTPRTLVVGTGKRDSLDRHQDDLILDLVAERTECGDFVDTYLFDKGLLAARTTDRITVPGRDAGPPPSWCGKESRRP